MRVLSLLLLMLVVVGVSFVFPHCSPPQPPSEHSTHNDSGVTTEKEDAPNESSTTTETVADKNNKPTGTVGCGKDAKEGASKSTIQVDGIERSFLLYVPKNYDKNKPTPLVFNFHGGGSNAEQQQLFSNLDTKAEKEGFLVVYPVGADNFWNVTFCCGDQKADDVKFVRALLENLKDNVCLDSKRVYATGMSNGGHMAFRLACEASDIFAAVAPVAGLTYTDCDPKRAVPILHFHGTADKSVPYEGGKEYKTNNDTWTSPKVEDVFADWGKRNKCQGEPKESLKQGETTCKMYSECDGKTTVTLCTSQGMGHCWPGNAFCVGGKSTEDINANDLMWSFFQKHTLD